MVDLKEKAISLLSTTVVSFGSNGQTTLFTVPAGKRAILREICIVAAADAGAGTTITVGEVGALTNFLPTTTLSNLDNQYDAVWCAPLGNTTPLKSKSYPAGTVIQVDVGNNSGAAGNTIYLFGFLY